MKRKLRYSVILAAVMVVAMASVALAVANAYNLGPFARYVHREAPPERQARAPVTDPALEAMCEAARADWAGKVFDENGRAIDDLAPHIGGAVFDANGGRLNMDIREDKLFITPCTEEAEEGGDPVTKFPTLLAAKPYLAFDPVLPTALPSGYRLDHLEMYGEPPRPGSKYLTAVYAGPGGEMRLMMQLMDAETAFEAGSGLPIRQVQVAGHSAVVEDESDLDVLVNGVLYSYMPCKSGVALDDLIRMAESAK